MALKTRQITIENGRDKGRVFLITEMSAAHADNWAMRALLALANSGAETSLPIWMAHAPYLTATARSYRALPLMGRAGCGAGSGSRSRTSPVKPVCSVSAWT